MQATMDDLTPLEAKPKPETGVVKSVQKQNRKLTAAKVVI